MCLTKKVKDPIEATEDIYVLKYGYESNEESFISAARRFTYKKGVVYNKRWISKFRAKRVEELNGEVYHTFSRHLMIELVRDRVDSRHLGYGVFRIPKGTKYYEGKNGDLGTFSVEYIGNSEEAFSTLKKYLRRILLE